MPALGFEHSGTTIDISNPKSHYLDIIGKLTYIRLSDINCWASARQAISPRLVGGSSLFNGRTPDLVRPQVYLCIPVTYSFLIIFK